MTAGGSIETVGENIEFSVAAASDVTVYFTGGANTDKTSDDNTLTEKYTDRYGAVKVYQIRPSEAIQIVSINGEVMTDPITCAADSSIIEKYDTPVIFKIVIRTTTANTNIKIRVRGR